ncbi:MAG: monovalent cation/H+ antiporter complex subunit F [Thermoflexales bacterium]|nr:monovalent cation/H+ antiporter complex subunit F [Thermoflexales bacterium]MCX7939777.1 monovalent cation/H+ antiporter complex subunit F [Thermoflexales bacterium]MDW8053188.1 monovalent cation/H+ antiporter complex subunit F [Anaerolineae bacterium]
MQMIFSWAVVASIGLHILLIAVAVVRVWRGETVLDRLVAADVIATLGLAIFVLLALFNDDALYMDLALGFAALSFVSTVALARYLANRQMF